MRILIVDDEELTREGLIASINWNMLNIEEIDQADDGVHGMKAARKHLPDIILTDVRMPRMNGIEMSMAIQKMNPDCSIIFMSGYSDKEYLKAAINLKAVRYVEKPINISEITNAISEAYAAHLQKKMQQKSLDYFSRESSTKLALRLTKPDFLLEELTNYPLVDTGLLLRSSAFFTTLIIKFKRPAFSFYEDKFTHFINTAEQLTAKYRMHSIYALKHDTFFILHLFGKSKLTDRVLKKFCQELRNLLNFSMHFFIVAGKTVNGVKRAYQSYNTAVVLLQSSFFFDYGDILFYKKQDEIPPVPPIDPFRTAIIEDIQNLKLDLAKERAVTFYQKLHHNKTILPNNIKDIYYKIFMQINHELYQKKLSITFDDKNNGTLLEQVAECGTFTHLHYMLLQRLDRFLTMLDEVTPEHTTVFLIKDYIGKNYMNDSLSIKEISSHIHLSSSYLCTIFKSETGHTLNQYITEFRMEKAKQLLADPRNRILDISAKVGYVDGGYFGKSFKKVVGLSPSEYRERKLL